MDLKFFCAMCSSSLTVALLLSQSDLQSANPYIVKLSILDDELSLNVSFTARISGWLMTMFCD